MPPRRPNKPTSAPPAKSIQNSIQHRQIARPASKSMQAHEQIARKPVVENLAPEKKQGYGTDVRHRHKGYLKLEYELPFEVSHSIHMQDVIGGIKNGRLATEIGKKAYPEMIVDIFRELNPESFSQEREIMRNARDDVMHTLNSYAKGIWPLVWLEKTPTAQTVINAIRARRHILHFFTSPMQLEAAENYLTRKTKFPGWLALSSNEELLKKVFEAHGKFTANELFTQKITENGESKNVYSKLQQTTEQLRKLKMEEELAGLEIIDSTRQIMARISREPSRAQLPKEYTMAKWMTNGDSLFSNSFTPAYRTAIVTLPGPLEIAKMHDGIFTAVIVTGDGIQLRGLTQAEQNFVEAKYESELSRKKAEKNREA